MVAESAVAKLNRAAQHMDSFVAGTAALSVGINLASSEERSDVGREHVWRIGGLRPIPIELSLIVGDCLFNIRSALDHLVWDLTRPEGSVPRCEFPLFDDPRRFNERRGDGTPKPLSGLGKISGLTEVQQKIVETLQPYHSIDAEDATLAATCDNLGLLNEIHNSDKHRTLSLACTSVNEMAYTPQAGVRIVQPDGALENDSVVLRLVTDHDDRVVRARPELGVGIVISTSRGLQNAPALLWQCHRAVREVLLRVADVETHEVEVPPSSFVSLRP